MTQDENRILEQLVEIHRETSERLTRQEERSLYQEERVSELVDAVKEQGRQTNSAIQELTKATTTMASSFQYLEERALREIDLVKHSTSMVSDHLRAVDKDLMTVKQEVKHLVHTKQEEKRKRQWLLEQIPKWVIFLVPFSMLVVGVYLTVSTMFT